MATNYNPAIVTDGLVMCCDAANSKSYPGSGTTFIDVSGNGNDGSLNNSPTHMILKVVVVLNLMRTLKEL